VRHDYFANETSLSQLDQAQTVILPQPNLRSRRPDLSNMATQPSTSAPIPSHASISGFFDTFPRELRDQTYDLLYEELDDSSWGLEFHTYTVGEELRLVSRQFKLEYDERTSVDKRSRHLAVGLSCMSHDCWC
jgi:hypothetical protein